MVDLTSLALFMTATLALNLAPGPDMLYVSTRSLTQGRRAGVISALGIAAGSVVHTVVDRVGTRGAAACPAARLRNRAIRGRGVSHLAGRAGVAQQERLHLSSRWIARASGRSFARARSPTS